MKKIIFVFILIVFASNAFALSGKRKNIERQTEVSNNFLITPINPFDDKTRIDDE